MNTKETKKSNKAELVKKLEKLVQKIKATREKNGENYLEECQYVFEMHREAKEAGDPDRDLPMLRDELDIGKSTARKKRKMHEFWNAQSKEVAENFPKLFSKIGRTKLELVCCLKSEKDAGNKKGYKKKKHLRFDDLIIEGDVATVKLVNPEGSVVVHEKSERELKEVLSSSGTESKDSLAESVEAADSLGADARSSQESEELHPKYTTYPALKRAYEALEAKMDEKDRLIAELLAGKAQSERVVENPSTPSAEDQEQTEAEFEDTPELDSGTKEEAQHLDAVPPKGEKESSAIENVEEPSEQSQDDFEIEDITLEEETVIPVEKADTKPSRQPAYANRSKSLAGTPNVPSQTAMNREASSCTHV